MRSKKQISFKNCKSVVIQRCPIYPVAGRAEEKNTTSQQYRYLEEHQHGK